MQEEIRKTFSGRYDTQSSYQNRLILIVNHRKALYSTTQDIDIALNMEQGLIGLSCILKRNFGDESLCCAAQIFGPKFKLNM